MKAAEKIAVVNKYVKAFETKDMNLIREIFADNAIVEDPVGSEPHRGIDEICGFYEQGFSMDAKLKLTGAPRCAGNSVAFAFSVFVGAMTIDPIDVFEFNNAGKVISMKAYWGPENVIQ